MPPVCSHRTPGLGDGGVGAVGAAHRAADAEAALGEVQAVAADAPDAVGLLPVDQGRVHAALLDEVLHQAADLVVREGRQHAGVHAEALVQAAHHVVLAAALPGAERPGGADAALAGIQAQHDLAQGHRVVLVGSHGLQIQIQHRFFLPLIDPGAFSTSFSPRPRLRSARRTWP